MFRYLLILSVSAFVVCHATHCSQLQQSQLSSVASLNERMSQMLNALYSSPLHTACAKAKSTNTTPSTYTNGVTSTNEYPGAILTSSIPNAVTSLAPVYPYPGLPASPYPSTAPNLQIMFTLSPPEAQLPTVAVTNTNNPSPTSDSYSATPQIIMSPVDYQYQNILNTKQAVPTEPKSYEHQFKHDLPNLQHYAPQVPEGYSNQMSINPMPVQYAAPNNHANVPKQYGFPPLCSSHTSQNQSPRSAPSAAVPAQPVTHQNPYPATSPGADAARLSYSASGSVPPALHNPIPKSPVPTYPIPGHQTYSARCNPMPSNLPAAYTGPVPSYTGSQDMPAAIPYYVGN